MERKEKMNVGIDISKSTFWATISQKTEDFQVKHLSSKEFKNKENEYQSFIKWIGSFRFEDFEVSFTMEATGVYYECLANFLYNNGYNVQVVLPNKSKYFIKSLDIKSKTDKLDSKSLGQLGLERKLRAWQPIQPIYKEIKSLTRERNSLVKFRTQQKNNLHALNNSYKPSEERILRINVTITFLDNQIKEVEKQIKNNLKKDQVLKEKVKRIKTIPGINTTTVAIIVSETNGFEYIENAKQLTSFAGLDVKLAESGKWKGKTRISKQGNSHIRAALYFPALTAIRCSTHYKTVYNRILSGKRGSKIGITAIQRKLLILIYSIWKNEENYQEVYQIEKAA